MIEKFMDDTMKGRDELLTLIKEMKMRKHIRDAIIEAVKITDEIKRQDYLNRITEDLDSFTYEEIEDAYEALNEAREQDPTISKLTAQFKTHLKNLGKKLTVSVQQIEKLNKQKKMPTMIKHCVVAVMPKTKTEGKTKAEKLENQFIGAHNICFWSFKRHNLLTKDGKPKGARGNQREDFHNNKFASGNPDKVNRQGKPKKDPDPRAKQKTRKYETMFRKVFKSKK